MIRGRRDEQQEHWGAHGNDTMLSDIGYKGKGIVE